MAVSNIANKIFSSQISCALASGVESMTRAFGPDLTPSFSDQVNTHPEGVKVNIQTDGTNEIVAEKYSLSRRAHDEFVTISYQRSLNSVKNVQYKEGDVTRIIFVDTDEGVRRNVTVDSLGKIKTAFKKDS
ncbi:hypothetical protein BABINDRAFT_10365 [Babjeviella inositovora NRRL Y-12698]|uniref:Thiolase N-terminal domain-containing protein n=1 Tax=Babjeviella inositovora NRRL Y-12698 TaxID=984486 RepID=A0A1E3QJP3_9ASCO|nr:uncharacterized protein BABINDRAFT_10365 [Babjeviella inositovora NRRL Y-12698]ODQ77217.1 hypothetical protein BABINDRAFT_10365 [Babjeviella inositovora NRRL Y-12698]